MITNQHHQFFPLLSIKTFVWISTKNILENSYGKKTKVSVDDGNDDFAQKKTVLSILPDTIFIKKSKWMKKNKTGKCHFIIIFLL